MDRVTKEILQMKVDYLSRRLGLEPPLYIDDYAPESNPYRYQLVQHLEHGEHLLTNYRMTAREFKAYLNGMIDCIGYFAVSDKRGKMVILHD